VTRHRYRATPIGDFAPNRTTLPASRPVAYCGCGARLSRYRPPATTRCWVCETAAKIQDQPA
jgi:hypothetical protein